MAITSIKTGSSFTNLVKYNDFLAGNPAFFPSSFESIASATGTGSAGSITFTSIPSTYKHLQIRALAQDTNTNNFAGSYNVQFNSDTGSNYAYHQIYGDGASVASVAGSSVTYINLANATSRSGTTQTMGVSIIDIHDYASTTKNKTLRAIGGSDNNLAADGSYFINLYSGLWMNTNAITSITLIPGNNFSTRTVFSLYGIKGA